MKPKSHDYSGGNAAFTALVRAGCRAWARHMMVAAISVLYACGPALSAASDPVASASETETSLHDLELAWARFAQQREEEQMERLLLDGFVFVDAAGAVKNRHEYVNDIRSGKTLIEDWRIEASAARVVGGTAVVSLTVGVIGQHDRRDVTAFYQVTDVFVREAGEWRALSRQETRITSRTDPLYERVGKPDGKPRVVLLVQGSFCPHCMAQLSTFAKQLSDRKYAVTVVSADTEEDLQRFPDVPFKLLADPQYKLFRKFGAFDDGPLHATLALDGTGAVVFRTAGQIPFMMADVVAQWVEKAAATVGESADGFGQ